MNKLTYRKMWSLADGGLGRWMPWLLAVICLLGSGKAMGQSFFLYTNWKTNESAQIISTNTSSGSIRWTTLGAGSLTFRTFPPTPGNVAVWQSLGLIQDGSDLAQPGLDYTPYSVQIPNVPFRYDDFVPIINDRDVEFNEDILVGLVNSSGVVVDFATLTIEHDDPPSGAVDLQFTKDPPYDDTNINPGANSFVYSTAEGFYGGQRKIYIGGDFTSVNTATNKVRIARLNNDGSVDFNFDTGTGADGFVSAIGVNPDGTVIIGGAFNAVNAYARSGVAKLGTNGVVDTSFNPGIGARVGEGVGAVRAIAIYTNAAFFGRILVAGDFTSYNGTNQNYVTRLLANGNLDTSFAVGSGANGPIYAARIQSDGKVILAGDFTSFAGVPRNRIVRLTGTGQVDPTFNPGSGADGTIYAIALDKQLPTLVGGSTISTNLNRTASGGAAEDIFDLVIPAPPGTPPGALYAGVLTVNYDFLVVPDTLNVYLGTNQTAANRLYASGQVPGVATVTIPFGPSTNSVLRVIINEGSGLFGTLWLYDLSLVAVVSTQPQPVPAGPNSVIIGGEFNNFDLRARSKIARLNADGTLDITYDPGSGFNDTVFALDMDPILGRVVAGGLFTSYNSTDRTNLARLNVNGDLDTSFMDTAYNQRAGPTNNSFFVQSFISTLTVQTDGSVVIGGGFTGVGGDDGRLGVSTEVGGRQYIGTSLGHTWPQLERDPNDFSGRFREKGGTGGTRYGLRNRNNLARVIGGETLTTYRADITGVPGGPGNMQFTTGNYQVNEFGTNSVITVQHVKGRLGTVTVDFVTSDLSATAGSDYIAVNDTRSWVAAHNVESILMYSSSDLTNKNFTVQIINDLLVEGNEHIQMDLINPRGGLLLPPSSPTATNVIIGAALGTPSRADLTIIDDDFNFGVFNFATTNFTVNENGGNAIITVTRTGGSVGAVSVHYATGVGGSATAGADYTPVSGTLTFAPGQTVRTFSVPIVNDQIVEFDETIPLSLSNPTGGATLGPDIVGTLTIYDDDNNVGTYSFTTNRFYVSETGGVAIVTVQRTSGSSGTTMVTLKSFDGVGPNGAVDTIHYTGITTNLTFGNGITSQTVAIPILDDPNVNVDRVFNVALSNPTGGSQLGVTANSTVTIVNDDAFGDLSFASTDYLVNEKGTNAVISVIRKNGVSGTITVNYATIPGGTAAAGSRYSNVQGTLMFNPGQTVATFLVPIIDDTLVEPEETVLLSLSMPMIGGLGTPSSATLTILDDESLNFPAGQDDTSFNPIDGPDNFVYSVAVQANRKLVVGGAFQFFNGTGRNRIARLNSSGTLDNAFQPGAGANNIVRSVVMQPDGRILIAGDFTQYDRTNRNYLARLNADGAVDAVFNPGPGTDNAILSMALNTNGLVVVGGKFTFAWGLSRNRIAVFNTNGTLNTAFNPGTGADDTVRSVAIHTNGINAGKVVIVGDFGQVNAVKNGRVARLNLSDGTLDAAFAANVASAVTNGVVYSVAIHPDGPNAGKIVIGGVFTSVSGVARTNIARLNEDGTLDASFAVTGAGTDGGVFTLAIDEAGKILIGGEFTSVGSIGRNRFARLNANGTLDTTINIGSGANSFVQTIATQVDQKIVIGGGFTTFNGRPRNYLTRILGGTTPGAGVLQFTSVTYGAIENDPAALITVQRTAGQDDAVSVNYALVGGTAVAGQDYTNFTAGTLQFTNGQTFASFSVQLADDQVVDGTKTMQFQLSSPTNITQGNVLANALLGAVTNATLNIADNDSVLSFSASSYSISEGGGAATITVVRSGGVAGPVSVKFFTQDGTAQAGLDYIAVSNTLSFASGETSKTFAVPIIEDTLVEGNETVIIGLTNAVGQVVVGQPSVVLTIVDNDLRPGTISFLTTDYLADENDGLAPITVVRTNGTSGTVTVQFSTADGSALAGLDYISTNGVLTFADGETVKTFYVPILSDTISTETNETVNLSITGATGGAALGGQNTATLTIQNNNEFIFGGFRFSTNSYSVAENGGSASVTILREGGTSGVVSVVLFTAGGTATEGLDYTGVTITNVFADGQTSTNVLIPIINEVPPLAEGDETIGLYLTNAMGGASLAKPSSATLTIIDDDFLPGVFVFSTNNFVFSETATNAIITVLRTNGLTGTVTVDYATGDRTARSGVDYSAVSGTLTFGDGVTSNAFLVPLIHNPLQRGNFDAAVSLSNPTGSATIGTSSAGLTILDAEAPAGTTDASFALTTGANATVYSLFQQLSSAQLLVAGDFTQIEGQGRNYAAVLNADASVAPLFVPGFIMFNATNASIRSASMYTNGTNLGKVVIGGTFTTVDSIARGHVARLNTDGTLDTNFTAIGANSAVNVVIVQNNGRVLVGGQFTSINGTNQNFIARLLEDGTIDSSFNIGTGPNAVVRSMTVDSSGRIYVGGDFTVFDGVAVGRVARLHADGSLDKTFDPGLGFNGPVRVVKLQADGRLVVGGEFTTFSITNSLGRLARLNSDGTLDGTFMAAVTGTKGGNDFVDALALQPDGKIAVGGAFTSFNGFTNENRFVRLEATGVIDPTFNTGTGFNDFVSSIVIQPDGRIVVGGGFTLYSGATHNRLIRLNGGANVGVGNLDFTSPTFSVNENGTAAIITVARTRGTTNAVSINFSVTDGSAIGGTHYVATNGILTFSQSETLKYFLVPIIDNTNVVGDVTVNLSLYGATNVTTGLRDDSLLGSVTNAVLTIVEDDGVIGFATSSYSVGEAGGTAAITLLRAGGLTRLASVDFVTSNLTAQAGFDYASVSNRVVFQPGQSVATVFVPIINDTLVEGNETVALTLLNITNAFPGLSTATLTIIDDEFNPGVLLFAATNYTVLEGQPNAVITVLRTNGSSGTVSVDYQATDGTALAGQDYVSVTNTLTFADGEVSKAFFVPIIDDSVAEPDETVLLTLSNPGGGAALGGSGAFGSLDANFNLGTGPNNTVRTMTLQPDGSILIGGQFQVVDGLPMVRISRLGPNGSVDASFNPAGGFSGGAPSVDAIGLYTFGTNTGRMIVGGEFTNFRTNTANRIARLDAGGQLDPTFNTGTGFDAHVRTLAIYQSGTNQGKVLVGGDFTSFNATSRNRIARLNADGSIDPSFNPGTGFNGTILGLAIGAGDAVIAVGTFNTFATTNSFVGVAGLNQDGSVNTNFLVGVGTDTTVRSVVIQPNGQILIAGDFTTYNGVARAKVARLQANGALDTSFDPGVGPNAGVRSIGLQPDGKVVIAGSFTSVNNVSRSRVDRLNADGSRDVTFDPGVGADADINSVLIQPDGKVVIGGAFTMFNGININRVARLELGSALGLAVSLLTIIDNDVAIGFTTNAYAFAENGGVQTISVVRSGLTNQQVTVDYTTEDGTAFGGLDFTPAFGSLSFAPGVTNLSFNVTILDDLLVEGDENFTLRLSNAAGVNLVGNTVALATILDNDTNYDLTVGVSVMEPVYRTSNFVYQIVISNRGPSTVTGASLTNLLPAALTFLGESNTLGVAHVQSGASLGFDVGTLTNGAGAVFYLTNTAPNVAGFVTNLTGFLPLALGTAADLNPTDNFSTNSLLIRNDSPFIANDITRSRLTFESVSPANGAVDPGETVTLALVLQNIGNLPTSGLIGAVLQNTNNVVPLAVTSTNYGSLAVGQRATNSYTFMATGTNGQTVTAVFYLSQAGAFLSNNIVRVNFTLGTGTNYTNNIAITIPDLGPADPYPSTISVSNLVGTISRVTVTLSNLFHSYPADIDMILVSPTGERVMLMSDAGAAPGPNAGAITNVTLTFDDSAATVIPQSSKLTTGSYRPANYNNPLDALPDTFPAPAPPPPYQTSLQAFNGLNPNGVWSLYIVDDEAQNLGGIKNGWNLNITAVTPVSPTAALALDMVPSMNTVFVGSNLVYTLVVTNYGPSAATSVFITNTLPANVSFVAATNASGSFAASSGRVVFSVGTLAVGAVSTNYLEIIPRVAGGVTNTATVVGAEVDPFTANNTASVGVTAAAQADVYVTQNVSATVGLGGSFTNTITVGNFGPSTANSVTLTSSVPVGTTATSRTTTQGSVAQSGNLVTVSVGTLASNATAVVRIVMTANVEGTLLLTSSASSSVTDLNATNNTVTSVTSVTPSADLAVTMTAAPNPVTITSNLVYSITVTNRGLSGSTNVIVTDVLPGSLPFVGAAVSQGSVANTGGTIAWSVGNLAANASASMNLTVAPIVSGGINNTVIVTSSTPDTNAINDSVTTTVTVNNRSAEIVVAGAALLAESGGTLNGQIDPGETVTVSLSLRNKGGSPTTAVMATLLNSGGVSFSGSQTQNYGALAAGGTVASRTFTFTASGVTGGTVLVSLQLSDQGNSLGTITFPFSLGAVNTFTNSSQIVINDNAPASPYPSANTVSGISGSIIGLTVTINGFAHSYPDDVDMLLVSPGGRAVMLMSDAGGARGISQSTPVTITFDDAAAVALPDEFITITNGTYKPSNYLNASGNPGTTNDTFAVPTSGPGVPDGPYSTNLSTFNGTNPNGDWRLYIMDDTAQDSGVILGGWSLRITSVTTVNPSVDLAVSLSSSPSPAFVGSAMTYTVIVTNSGPNVATNLVVSNIFPASATFVSASSSAGTATNNGGGLVTFGVPTLDIGARVTNTVAVIPTVLGTLNASASVSATQTDLVPANNTATLISPVYNLPVDLALSVLASTNTVTVGSNLTYTIVVTNLGPNTATGAAVTNLMDVNTAFVSATAGGGGSFAVSGQSIVFNLPPLASSAWVTNLLVVRTTHVGSITDAASTGISSQTETNLVNNAVTLITTVEGVQLTSITSMSNGSVMVGLTGRINKTYVVEASTNLITWLPIYTNTSLSGAFTFIDTNSVAFPTRFYRAIER